MAMKQSVKAPYFPCLLYTSPSPRDRTRSRMPSSAEELGEDYSEKEFWEETEDKQEANMFDKKEAGGKDSQWKRFQMGWQIGIGLNYNQLYVGIGYGKDFTELCKKVKTSTTSITLGYNF